MSPARRSADILALLPLAGPGGEPIDLWRTLFSHGVASLPPNAIDETARTLTTTLAAGGETRTVRVAETAGAAAVTLADAGPLPPPPVATALVATIRRLLDLDTDLSPFYARCAADPTLAWAAQGAGRILRSPSVFEDVVKTVCTTNCAWSATERMVGAIVAGLGDTAPGAPASGPAGHGFPTPAMMAGAGEAFYRDVARAGYRGPHLLRIARDVAAGELDLEALLPTAPDPLDDDEVAGRLLALPGVGPYAAAHVMMLLGRHSRLILDSWTRPKYARVMGKPAGRLVADKTILRRFGRYRTYAGLAFWLVVTRDWVD